MGALHRHSTSTASDWLYWLYWYRHRTALPGNTAFITNATPASRLVSVNRRRCRRLLPMLKLVHFASYASKASKAR